MLALVVVVAASACGSSGTSSTTTPTVTISDPFSGTVAVGGSDFHTFGASQSGQVAVTLNTAGPPATIIMGLAIGTPNGTTCTPLAGASVQTAAGSSPQLNGEVSGGTLCVVVYDVGNETAPITYSLTVGHP
ncbi:MAG TPA: hypothetical protein VG222_13735 [Vicinamibacterales bacterium]|nr:hypothetical protein [Vicinamibacterales bacterium]